MAMTLEQVKRILADHKHPSFERDTVEALVDEIERLTSPAWPIGKSAAIKHDGFEGTVQGHYLTREGKRGVVVQQDGTRVVHVYGEKWLTGGAV